MEDLTYVVENPVLVLDDTYCLGFTLDTTKEILVNEFNAKQVFTAGLFRLLPHYSEDPSRLKKADFYGVFLPDKAEKAPYFWHTVRAWINDRSFGRDDFLSLFEKTKEQEREIFEKYLPHDLSILASEAEVVFKASKDLQNPGRGYQNAEEIINDRIKEWDGITVDFKKQEKKPFEIRNFSGFSEKAGDFKDLLNEVYNNILPEEVRNIIRLQQPPNNGIINIGVSSTLQSNVAKIISPETGEVWVLFDERFVKEILYKSDDTISADMSPEEIEFSSQWLLMERFYVFMYSNYVPAFNAIRDGTDDFLIESFGMGETLQASIKNELDQILNKTYDIGKAGKEKREGLLFVVSGPSGSGKTTIVNSSLKKLQNTALRLKRSISSTTRKQRRDEVDGIDYRFLSEEEFFEKINKNEFLEWTQIFGDYYGTELNFIDDASKRGEDLMLVIDVEGFRKIKKIIPEGIGIFILPPEDTEQLRRRLIKRGDNTPAEIEIRLARTKYELNEGQDYNYQIINDDLDEAVSDFNAIIEMETKKAEKLAGYIPEEIAKDEKRLHRHVFSLAEEVWVIRTFNRLIGYLQSREYSIQEIISRRMKDYNKRVPNSNNRFSSAKFYHPQSGLLSFMLGGERDADKKLIRAVISRHSFYDDDLFVKSMPSKTANDEKVLDGKWVVYDNALQETERIHMKNLEITPECDEKKILCHIIIDSIFSSGQKKVLKTLEQDMRDEKYREKIVSLSIDRDRDFEEQVKREMQNQRDLYKGYTVIFDIACPSIDDVRDMLKDGPDIKALAFSPETADEGNFIQIESIMAALRVLHADDLNRIKEVIESLTGEELDIEKRGIKTIDDFIKTVIITLPSIRVIDYYDFKNLNDIMVKSIKSAA